MINIFGSITILEESQLLKPSDYNALKTVDLTKSLLTDFTLLLNGKPDYVIQNDDRKADHVWLNYGPYFIQSRGQKLSPPRINTRDRIKTINYEARINYLPMESHDISFRPAISLKGAYDIKELMNQFPVVYDKNNIMQLEIGEYPQMTVTIKKYIELLNAYQAGNYEYTGKTYTTNRPLSNDIYAFRKREHEEIKIDGKKYIRVDGSAYFNENIYTDLSSGLTAHGSADQSVFIEVKPIRWYYDASTEMLVSEYCLFSGIEANSPDNSEIREFKETPIKEFVDLYFSKEIQPYKPMKKTKFKTNKKENPYNFNFNKVTEEDIIRGAVEAGVPVFLHGLSSDGKSARVKQIDKDAVIIYLRNASPDSLNGKSIVGTEGKLIDVPPTWYQKLKEKCEAQPDKINILFFDEITNATPNIQGMAYNIILDKEVNGVWKLPANARIVAAGNDYNDSLAANQLAEPLFNRFAHVYIKTNVEDWLKWAVTADIEPKKLDYEEQERKHKIHPSIFAYISSRRERALRTDYTGDKPNADPRKWEMASKILYKTGQPEMLRALIGASLTRDFVQFCKMESLTLEDVLKKNYSDADLKMNIDAKWATIVSLTAVKSKDLSIVRDFVSKLEKEFLPAFDSLWMQGDQEKMEIIAELRLKSESIAELIPKLNVFSIEGDFPKQNGVKPSTKQMIEHINRVFDQLDTMDVEKYTPENLDKLKEFKKKLRERNELDTWKRKK